MLNPTTRVALLLCLPAVLGVDVHVVVTPVPASFEIRHGPPKEQSVAWGSFHNGINQTGFGILEVFTNGSYPDEYQAYGAGLLEGYFTRDLIRMHFDNQWADYCQGESEYCQRLYGFLQENLQFMNQQVNKFRGTDPYWHQVGLALDQLAGIDDALQTRARYYPLSSYVNVTDLLFLNVDGDLEDLEQALKRIQPRKVLGSGSCSALVKLLPGNKDLYFSQVTWSTYASMLRILKKYHFQYHLTFSSESKIPGHTATFSSSPGRIFSGDDFYLLSSGLATMETTIGNGNSSLLKYIVPTSNLEYIRNIVANRLATSGSQWCDIFAKHNSGTYNNQWMVLDYKKFRPGGQLQDNLLWVLEQLPGYVMSADVTDVLRDQSYWPSYNTPYFQRIFNLSGGPEAVAKFGDWFSYNMTPRARIFRRDHHNVHDMRTMTKLMRYNNYTKDPLSACNCTPPYSAENAISARSDLNPADGVYPFPSLGHRSHGSTDMKLTNSTLFERLEFIAVGGPTYDPLPPFQWSTSGFKDKHQGQPDLWQFTPFIHHWKD
ncbi:putative phospholipase B-like 2 [Ornithodoros turicata]|uniref:putative phospholipase B-like 2 n=1 Tax=Ornithodoros turicata TaxID=34597 RepID=UPI0031397C72